MRRPGRECKVSRIWILERGIIGYLPNMSVLLVPRMLCCWRALLEYCHWKSGQSRANRKEMIVLQFVYKYNELIIIHDVLPKDSRIRISTFNRIWSNRLTYEHITWAWNLSRRSSLEMGISSISNSLYIYSWRWALRSSVTPQQDDAAPPRS